MATREQLAQRAERFRAILGYVLTFAGKAPVSADQIQRFLLQYGGFEDQSQGETDADISWLVSDGSLTRERSWDSGRWIHRFEITAKGQDRFNGALPPAGVQ